MSPAQDAQGPQAGLRSLLEHMLKIEASELYLSAGSPPVFRVHDAAYPGRVALEAAEIAALAEALMSAEQREQFKSTLELDLVLALGGGTFGARSPGASDARFCVNLFWQRRAPALVVRALPARLRTLGELGLPSALAELAFERSGLVLIAGERRSGKSSTLAALVDHRNGTAPGHLLTIEDPIVLLHAPKQCIVSQREVGVDTRSYLDALRQVPRQAPDLLMVDALRSGEVLQSVVQLAAGGQLCLSSVHARGAVQALEQLLNLVPPDHQPELRQRLAFSLRAVIAQRLVPAAGGGRTVVLEILRGGAQVEASIRRGDFAALSETLSDGANGGGGRDHALQGSAFDPLQLRFAPELPDTPRAGKR